MNERIFLAVSIRIITWSWLRPLVFRSEAAICVIRCRRLLMNRDCRMWFFIVSDIQVLKLSGGDIKAVQGDSGHAQADMVTEVYGHIIDEDRRKNAQRMEDAFYNRENLNPQMKGADAGQTANTVAVPEGVDADLLMKVLGNPEMAALLTSLAKSLKAE